MRTLYTGTGFTEGPVVSPDGLVWVSVSKGDVYREGSLLSHLGGGPNGATLGPDGLVYVTQNGGVDYVAWGIAVDEPYEPVAPGVMRIAEGMAEIVVGPEGLGAPNDLVFVDGDLYFTDPGVGLVLDGDMNVVSADFEYPNGIAAGPDGIWVADTARRLVACLADRRTIEMPGAGPDGIKFDDHGHLFAACTMDAAVHVFEDGRLLGSYVGNEGDLFTNCCLRGHEIIVTSSLAGSVVSFDLSERT